MASKRRVLLICGPPGAGKSTRAREIAAEEDLEVFDLDDPKWEQSEKRFRAALRSLGEQRSARAVVIRSAATLSARTKAAHTVGATEVIVLDTPAAVCRDRVIARKQQPPSIKTQIAAVDAWWRRYQPGPVFLGQAAVDPGSQSVFLSPDSKNGQRGRRGRGSTTARGYGAAHQKLRAQTKRKVDAGGVRCWRCGMVIVPVPGITGEGWDLGHDDEDRSIYRGPEHASCNRNTAAGRAAEPHSRVW